MKRSLGAVEFADKRGVGHNDLQFATFDDSNSADSTQLPRALPL
jgi:hypothetical protein